MSLLDALPSGSDSDPDDPEEIDTREEDDASSLFGDRDDDTEAVWEYINIMI